MPRNTALAALAGLFLLSAPAAALAGGDDGWTSSDRAGCPCDCGCGRSNDVHLPDGFFAGAGGVGPAFVDYGPTGGAEMIEIVRPSLFPRAGIRLRPRAEAQAGAFVRVGAHVRGGGMPMRGGGKHW